MIARLLAGAALIGLAGCTVGPDYHLPAKAAINSATAQGPLAKGNAVVAAQDLPARWWHLYDDPVLDTLEEQALAGSTDLRIAMTNLARAQALTAAAAHANEPEFSVDAAAQRARLSGEAYLQPTSLPVYNLANGGAQMSYQFDLFGRFRRGVELARADQQATAALVDAAKVTIAAEVARAYVEVCGAHAYGAIAEEQVAVQERILAVQERMLKEGKGSALEVSTAQTRFAEARARLPLDEIHAKAALYRLAFLLGRAPSDYPREAEACHSVPQLTRALPVGDGAALLARRPDVRAAERQLAAATAQIGVATADLYPRFGFAAGGGITGFLKDVVAAAASRWGIGALVQWNFPNSAARAKVRVARIDASAALARFDGTVLAALREVETAANTYAQNHDRLLLLTQARESSSTTARQIERLRQAGRAPALADLGGQDAELATRAREQGAREVLAQDQITLFLALGGGW